MSTSWRLLPYDPGSVEQATLWRGVAQRAAACSVLLPEFVFACAQTLAVRPMTLAVCGSVDGPRAVAILDQSRRLQPHVFIASQMPLGAYVAMPGECVAELATSLLRAQGLALRIGFPQLDSRFAPRPQRSAVLDTLDYIETAWVEIGGSFDDYWGARGKNLRTNMRRQRERLASQGVRARMEVLEDPGLMAAAVRDYASLESRGWKAAGGTAVSEEHPQSRFYTRMLERFALLGMARVYRYLFDERLVASELCLHDGSEIVILKTTYDESVAPLSPASLMRQDMFQSFFGDGRTRRVEFYGPVKEWHTRWTPLRRPIYHLNVYRSRLLMQARDLRRGIVGARRIVGPSPRSAQPATTRGMHRGSD